MKATQKVTRLRVKSNNTSLYDLLNKSTNESDIASNNDNPVVRQRTIKARVRRNNNSKKKKVAIRRK